MITVLPNLVPLVKELPPYSYHQLNTGYEIRRVVVFTISYGNHVPAHEDRYGIRRVRATAIYPYEDYVEANAISYLVVAHDPYECETNDLEIIASAIYTPSCLNSCSRLQIYDDSWSASFITTVINQHLDNIRRSTRVFI